MPFYIKQDAEYLATREGKSLAWGAKEKATAFPTEAEADLVMRHPFVGYAEVVEEPAWEKPVEKKPVGPVFEPPTAPYPDDDSNPEAEWGFLDDYRRATESLAQMTGGLLGRPAYSQQQQNAMLNRHNSMLEQAQRDQYRSWLGQQSVRMPVVESNLERAFRDALGPSFDVEVRRNEMFWGMDVRISHRRSENHWLSRCPAEFDSTRHAEGFVSETVARVGRELWSRGVR